jgi:hypothetical protein
MLSAQYGQILLNADGSYTYTLTSAPNSPNHVNDGPNVIKLHLPGEGLGGQHHHQHHRDQHRR